MIEPRNPASVSMELKKKHKRKKDKCRKKKKKKTVKTHCPKRSKKCRGNRKRPLPHCKEQKEKCPSKKCGFSILDEDVLKEFNVNFIKRGACRGNAPQEIDVAFINKIKTEGIKFNGSLKDYIQMHFKMDNLFREGPVTGITEPEKPPEMELKKKKRKKHGKKSKKKTGRPCPKSSKNIREHDSSGGCGGTACCFVPATAFINSPNTNEAFYNRTNENNETLRDYKESNFRWFSTFEHGPPAGVIEPKRPGVSEMELKKSKRGRSRRRQRSRRRGRSRKRQRRRKGGRGGRGSSRRGRRTGGCPDGSTVTSGGGGGCYYVPPAMFGEHLPKELDVSFINSPDGKIAREDYNFTLRMASSEGD